MIDGTPASLYSGAVHYWRLERETWEDILSKVKSLGFNTISIYMPWEVHEIERGKFDFGEIDPRKDLDAFLTLAEQVGLRTIARPGPQINSELTWFGYPRRILDDPDLQARNGQGGRAVLTQVPRPIPAVSYAVDKFFDEAALWYDAIMPILVKHQHPAGRLIAAQVDNEMAFFFHINPYACDYHPAAIARYQAFLDKKYGGAKAIGAAYGRDIGAVGEIEPPRRFAATSAEELPYYTDWIEYRERYLIDSMARLAGMMKDRGLDAIPLFHNYPHPLGPGGAASGITAPYNLMALEEELDFVGFDIYSRKELYNHVKTIVSYVVGSSRFPYIPEFIAGVWPWYLHPGDQSDEGFVTRAALMHGIKGFSRYMIVERDRWLGSPIRRDGRIREKNAAVFREVNDVLTSFDFKDLRRDADVLLLANRDYDRLEAATELLSFPGDFLESQISMSEYPNRLTISEKTFGFDDAIQLSKTDWFNTCADCLADQGYTYLLSDTALPADRLTGYKAVVVSSFAFMGKDVQDKLVAYAESGGVVILGPRLPSRDARMQAYDALRRAAENGASSLLVHNGVEVATTYVVGRGRVVLVSQADALPGAVAAALSAAGLIPVRKNDRRLDVAVHRHRDGRGPLIVFVANPTDQSIEAEVGLGRPVTEVREIWESRDVPVGTETWSDTLGPYTIKTYAVI